MNDKYILLRIINGLHFQYNDLKVIEKRTQYIFSKNELQKWLKELLLQEYIKIRIVGEIPQIGMAAKGIRVLIEETY